MGNVHGDAGIFALYSRNDPNMVIQPRIDEGQRHEEIDGGPHLEELGIVIPEPAGAAPDPPREHPALDPEEEPRILRARVSENDHREDAHTFIRDVPFGGEILVVNPFEQYEELDESDDEVLEEGLEVAEDHAHVEVEAGLEEQLQVETGSDQDIHTLDQLIRNSPGNDAQFTPGIGPFNLTPAQPARTVSTAVTPMVVSTGDHCLVEAGLEPVIRLHVEMAAKDLEKTDGDGDGDSVVKPVPKHHALKDRPGTSTLDQAGPFENQD